jgi:hypothetical protein
MVAKDKQGAVYAALQYVMGCVSEGRYGTGDDFDIEAMYEDLTEQTDEIENGE